MLADLKVVSVSVSQCVGVSVSLLVSTFPCQCCKDFALSSQLVKQSPRSYLSCALHLSAIATVCLTYISEGFWGLDGRNEIYGVLRNILYGFLWSDLAVRQYYWLNGQPCPLVCDSASLPMFGLYYHLFSIQLYYVDSNGCFFLFHSSHWPTYWTHRSHNMAWH